MRQDPEWKTEQNKANPPKEQASKQTKTQTALLVTTVPQPVIFISGEPALSVRSGQPPFLLYS